MTEPLRQADLRALVVDDEAITRGAVAFALQSENFACDVARDGEGAEDLLKEGKYDLLITDLRMPYKDGYALVGELLAIPDRPRIIVHTAYDNPRLTRELLVCGVDDVVSKPTDYAVFAAKARGIVERGRVDGHQSDCVESTADATQATTEEQLEATPCETPRESTEPEVESSDNAPDSIEPSAGLGSSANPLVGVTTRCVSSSRNAPVRAPKVFKISARPSDCASDKQPTQDKRTPASKSAAVQRKLEFIVPALIMTFIGAGVITAAQYTSPQNRDSKQNVAGTSPLAESQKNVTERLEVSTAGNPANFTRRGSSSWGMVSMRMEPLQKGRPRPFTLAAAHAAENPQAEPWSVPFEQALNSVSAGVNNFNKRLQNPMDERALNGSTKQSELAQAPPPATESGAIELRLDEPEARKSVSNAITLKSYAERPVALDRAQLEAEFLRDFSSIQKNLAPLLQSGNLQPEAAGKGTTVSQSPMSLTDLRRSGALSDSEEGLSKLARAMGLGNDHNSAESVPFTVGTLPEEHREIAASASRLLLKYHSILIEKGMLAE